jgi:hypothetical protein
LQAPSRTKASGAGLGKALINRKVKENNAPKESGLVSDHSLMDAGTFSGKSNGGGAKHSRELSMTVHAR